MAKLSIRDIELKNKRVFIRVDFNVPLTEDGKEITDDTRIVATLPTIEYALRHHAKVILASHLGRPKGKPNPKYSLRPVVDRLRQLIDKDVCPAENVGFSPDCVGEVANEMAHQLESGQVLLLENLRYHAEEEANDPAFSKALASLAEIYVNDAFGSAHRAHASTEGITHFLKPAVAGLLMEKEITYLGKALESPEKPFVAIIGGSKISGKIDVIDNLLDKVDTLVIVGGMAYTFQRALGVTTGKSLVEEDKIDMAKAALEKAKAKGVNSCFRSTTSSPTAFRPTPKPSRGTPRKTSPPTGRASTSAPSPSRRLKQSSPPHAPSCGMAPPASSSFRVSPSAPTPSPRLLQATRKPSPSLAAATPYRRSTRPAMPTRSPTSPPAAAPASSSSKAKSCPA